MCSDESILSVIYLVKLLIKGIGIVVPIILVVSVSITLTKSLTKDGVDEQVKKKCITNAIAAVCVFLVPTFVNLFMSILGASYEECWNNATHITIDMFRTSSDESGTSTTPSTPSTTPSTPSTTPSTPSTPTSPYKTYTNSKNGLTFNLYYQGDSGWGSLALNGNTVGESGCNMIAAAVISSGGNSSVTPKTLYDKGQGNSYPITSINDTAGNIFTCSLITFNKQFIIDELKKGNVFVIMAYGPRKGGSNPLVAGGQHYMALIDINDTSIYVGNSHNSQRGYSASGWFKIDEVLTSVQEVDYCKVK